MKHWMIVLAAVSALAFTGCDKQESKTEEVTTESAAPATESAPEGAEATPAATEAAPAETAPAEAAATPAEAAATPAEAAAAPTDAPAGAAAPASGQEVTLPGGTKYVDVTVGTGDEAVAGKTVVVHYTGTLEDGTQFDSSRGRDPFEFALGGGEVIKGWDNGVAGMKVGGQRKLTIPASEGYGDRGAGGVIKPGATLLFDVELLAVK